MQLIDYLPAKIVLLDSRGRITGYNRAWERAAAKAGVQPPFLGQSYFGICEAHVSRGWAGAADKAEALRRVLTGGETMVELSSGCPFSGLRDWYHTSVALAPGGSEARVVVTHTVVSDIQRDALTGLPTRAFFGLQLDYALGRAREGGTSAGVVVFDLDGFKAVNDTYGHGEGDQLLRAVAARLAEAVSEEELAARLGGDEFGVVLAPGTDAARAGELAARMGEAAGAIARGDGRWPVGVSSGWALFPGDGADADALLAAADAAMYAGKRARADGWWEGRRAAG